MPAHIEKILKFYNVILASASPRRAELIKKIPWLHATVFPSAAEEEPFCGGSVADYVQTLAKRKALWVLERVDGTVVGADTVVSIGGEVLGKPRSPQDAENMFRKLCGRTHEVITGYCVANHAKNVVNFEKTYVTFGAFIDKIVYNYIDSGAPFDKAGGYGLQDSELFPLIERVEGDADNVVGLPVAALEKTFKEFIEWL